MPFGMKVDIGPGEIVLDRDPVPPPQRGTAANSRPISVVAKWLIDQDATWYGSRPGQGDIVLDGDPAPLKGAHPPIFGPCLLWPNGGPSQLLLSTCFTGWML